MKSILVATDFSSPATNAVEYAGHLARVTGAKLILFNVYQLSIHARNSLASTSSLDKLRVKNDQKLLEMTKELVERFQIQVDWALENGETVESLSKQVAEHPVDLVVMGIESNLTEYKLFGNTTTAVIQLMEFPLLVVPNDIEFKQLNKVTYACDPVYLKDGCQLSLLKQFVRDFNADLEILHVVTGDPELVDKDQLEFIMDEILTDVDHTFNYINNLRVGDGISAGLVESPSDLLVMIPHKLKFFESIFKGSNTSRMTVQTRVPLLVIPNERAC